MAVANCVVLEKTISIMVTLVFPHDRRRHVDRLRVG
jgi:hypothetical protein